MLAFYSLRGNIGQMIYKSSDILNEILLFMDLNDGYIMKTDTPKGGSE